MKYSYECFLGVAQLAYIGCVNVYVHFSLHNVVTACLSVLKLW